MSDTARQPKVFDADFCGTKSRRYILVAAILASAMGFIDGSVISIAMPAIRSTLGASLVEAQWVSNSYMLALSALILVGGAFGDRFGLAKVFSFGIGLFILSSIACATAWSADSLIIFRFVQGVGAAMMVPGSMAMVARAYPREERGRALGIWAASASVTTAAGPIIGGLALTFWGEDMWRAIFAINLPLGGWALWLLYRHVAVDRAKGGQDQEIDFRGAFLATLGLGGIAFGLTEIEAGTQGAVPPILGGCAMLVLFVFWEARVPYPMLPLDLFAVPGFSGANIATFVLYTGFSAVLFFLPMLLISGWGISEIASTAAFFPLTIFIGTMSAWAGRTAGRIGAGPMIGFGAAIIAAGFVLLGMFIPQQNFWGHVVPSMCLMGFGMGFVVSPLSVAVMTAAPDEMSGAASGVNNAVARSAGLVAVAAFGGIAAIAYSTAGGNLSYGAEAASETHIRAMNFAFQTVAFGAAVLSAVAALVAYLFVPRP